MRTDTAVSSQIAASSLAGYTYCGTALRMPTMELE